MKISGPAQVYSPGRSRPKNTDRSETFVIVPNIVRFVYAHINARALCTVLYLSSFPVLLNRIPYIGCLYETAHFSHNSFPSLTIGCFEERKHKFTADVKRMCLSSLTCCKVRRKLFIQNAEQAWCLCRQYNEYINYIEKVY